MRRYLVYTVLRPAIGKNGSKVKTGISGWKTRELSKALKQSYAARSGYVHSGNPIDFVTSLLWAGNKVEPDAPLPFAILRSILVELIDAKLDSLASPYELPDVRITFVAEN